MMDNKKKIKILIFGSILGILWSIYLLYNRRGGYLITNDWISIGVTSLFMVGLIFYFKNKWKG